MNSERCAARGYHEPAPTAVVAGRARTETKPGAGREKVLVKRIVIPTGGAGDWAPLLAQPILHWKPGASAMCLAACWEDAHPDFPAEVGTALNGFEELRALQIVVAMPEFTTPLPGGRRASQTDLMVLARNSRGTAAIGVEGKVEEPFGPTVGEKRRDPSDGQSERLRFLEQRLGLATQCADSVRYQLLHRAVSVLLFAEETHARAAVLIVHSFSQAGSWYDDFAAFAQLLGADAERGKLVRSTAQTGVPLFVGWITGDPRFATINVPATNCPRCPSLSTSPTARFTVA